MSETSEGLRAVMMGLPDGGPIFDRGLSERIVVTAPDATLIVIKVLRWKESSVLLQVAAPREYLADRGEVWARKQAELAAKAPAEPAALADREMDHRFQPADITVNSTVRHYVADIWKKALEGPYKNEQARNDAMDRLNAVERAEAARS